ncbi:hypothetical protein JCGZ_00155 [Jatropha curcas]|uniref:Aminotransferase-like plant mobile domain-containing protein n=1 Tax=Jatropha curcas TaxID=180498 RepID=A0A067JH38_JATCU|nr:hypothetical protein JCGZ_00155 [Jatropha curcas]
MAHLPEIPAFTYTPKMDILGVIPDIPVFEGDQVPVSRKALTPGTRPLQLLPAPGSDFPIRHNTNAMHGFQFEDLSLISTYDWASLALAHLYHGLDGWTRGSGESNWQFLRPSRCGRMSTGYTLGVRRVTLLLRLDEFRDTWRIAIILFPAQRIRTIGGAILTIGPWLILSFSCPSRGPYPVQSLASGLLGGPVLFGGEGPRDSYCHGPATSAYCSPLAHVHFGWDDSGGQVAGDRKRHRTPAFYGTQAEADVPAGPMGVVLGDVPFPPGLEVALDPALGLGPTLPIPADLRKAPPQLQLDPEHATHMEVDRLQTRLEVEGIPLDFSEEEDDDGSSSDEATPPPPSSVRQAAASPSRRRRVLLFVLFIPPHSTVLTNPFLQQPFSFMAFRNQVSSFVQSVPDDLHFNPNTMVFRFEDSEVTPTYEEMCAVMGHHPDQNETQALAPGPRYDSAEVAALCPVYLLDGIDPD